MADSTGTTVWRWDQQEPFGNNPADEDPDANSVAFDLPLRLPGQRYDQETGLHYNYFRDYDPSIGRYGESDPIGLDGGLNTYAYVVGDPLASIDPTGEATYNTPDQSITKPVGPDMEAKVRCIENRMGLPLVITGGAESTTPRGKPAHRCKTSAHYSGDAVDFSFKRNPTLPGRGEEFFCSALKCGFEWGLYEHFPPHFHIQRVPGCNVPKIKVDPCKCS